MRMFMPIHKTEQLDDGTLVVTGIASTEAVDSDGEIIQAEAMKAALPDFFKYGTGALREMHQQLAAGTVDTADVSDGNTYISATVVDPVAITKVKAGVYKGFSIGGKVTGRDKVNKNLITGIRLVEVSLVDRPANPEAVINMYKSEATEEEAVPEAAPMTDREAIDGLAKMMNEKMLTPQAMLALAQASLAKADEPAPDAAADPVSVDVADQAVAAPAVDDAAKAVQLSADDLKKGMDGLAWFASILKQVRYLAGDQADEAAREADGSTLPAQLRAWLDAGLVVFANMTAEESAELLASVTPPAEEAMEVLAMADQADGLEKAGAKFSTATVAVLSDVHKMLLDGCSKMDGLGYMGADAGAKADSAQDVQKADDAGDLLKGELAKRDAVIDGLTKRLTALEAQPAPAKAILKAVGKGDDVPLAANADEVTPIIKRDGTTDDAATLIKSIHRTGGMPVRF